MKTIKKALSVILVILTSTVLHAQDWTMQVNDIRDYHRMINNGSKVTNSYDNIEGNPYYFEDFRKGSVITKNGKKYNGEFRYDLYADQIEFKLDGDIYWIANPELMEYIKIDGQVFVYYDKDMTDSKNGFYYQVLVMGECKLLYRKGINLKEAEPPKPYVDAKPATFIDRKPLYYIQKGIAYPQRVSNKGDLLENLSDKKQEVSTFIKKNKISVNNKDELINLIEFYNSL